MKTKFILIDFENLQPNDLAQLRGGPFRTMIFCGAAQTKVSLDLAAELQPFGADAEYVRIQGTGHNAVDFHIAFWIGRLSVEVPGAVFYIISKDKGFDPLIQSLKAKDIGCARVISLSGIPELARTASAAMIPQEQTRKILENLLKTTARPIKARGLKGFIKAQLNSHGTQEKIEAVFAELQEHGKISISPDGRVIYPPA